MKGWGIIQAANDLSRSIIAAIIDHDYFTVFGHGFELLFRISNTLSHALGFVVSWHDNGYSIFYETFDEF